MFINTQRFFLFFLFATCSLFSIFGCDGVNPSKILEDVTGPGTPTLAASSAVTSVSFENDILPILTARCAFAGCHVAGGPDNLDFSTYQTLKKGGEDGPVVIPGNPNESDIIEEIVSERMPPGGPPLTDAQIRLFIDWINEGATNVPSGQSVPPIERNTLIDDDDHDDDRDDKDDENDREDDEDDEERDEEDDNEDDEERDDEDDEDDEED
ncbi:hypothetical protein F4X10_23250 [Candidatus Poribacteria bacterium]|nr:hypothetical protein [Candidatus Poribacteria bacterium]